MDHFYDTDLHYCETCQDSTWLDDLLVTEEGFACPHCKEIMESA